MKYFALLLLLAGCSSSLPPPAPPVSSTIALTSDDGALWVVTPDADSVSVIDPTSRKLLTEILLATAPPSADPQTGRYEPVVKPRALAFLPDDSKVYVAGQTANAVLVIDAARRSVSASIPVGAEPTAVVAAPSGDAVYVVSHEAAIVTKIDPASERVLATLPVGEHPWGASLSADGRWLYVSQFLLHPGVTVIDTASFTIQNTVELAEQMPDPGGKLVPNGVARGVYSAVPRPVGGEVWLPHMLLAIKTSEPDLDFQSTTFPTISTVDAMGAAEGKRLLFKPLDVPGATGAFNDVVSQPRAIAFTPDGALALVANSASEDLLILDGKTGNERGLVRPLPAAFLEGIAVDRSGHHAYVDGRNTHNVVVLSIGNDPVTPVAVDGDPIERLSAADPMPDMMRQGQRLFYSANSAAFPITQNFWVSCSSCHLEGGTDAVTWLFNAGPRDTPSNGGGPINTGFLMRQALRNSVTDYDVTINVEQGGNFHRADSSQEAQLEELAAFVNFAIPLPQNPNLSPDGTLTDSQTRGQATFNDRCASCHAGAFYTDSGAGNATLDENGTILLHDVGTCVQSGPFNDEPQPDDVIGNMHTACDFDTPTLRGIFATAPYFHDGSAATLLDAVNRLPFVNGLSDSDKADLVAFLQTL